jgi:hypothetical protein
MYGIITRVTSIWNISFTSLSPHRIGAFLFALKRILRTS